MNTRIVFSPSRRRPGCALLQAALGGDVDGETFRRLFPAETWLVAPTEDMGAYPIDEKHNLETLSAIAHAAIVQDGSRSQAASPNRRQEHGGGWETCGPNPNNEDDSRVYEFQVDDLWPIRSV